MRLLNYLMSLSLLLLISACAKPEVEYVDRPVYVERNIPTKERPRGVTLNDVEFKVLNKDNVEAILPNGDSVVIAMSVDDYEDLAVNMQELKRYIQQQGIIIDYYEEAIKTDNETSE